MRLLLTFGAVLLLCSCGSAPEKPKPSAGKAVNSTMPDVYQVLFDTSKGSFVVEVHKDWAPKGAERFWKLVNAGFFDNSRIFRVRPDFIVQFGLAADPQVTAMFNASPIDDDPVKQKNTKGTIAFAQSGPRSRRTQVFVNLKDNPDLDKTGFVPFGEVRLGLDVFEKLYAGYGEWEPPGHGPNVARIQTQGNSYLDERFPRLDKILRAKVTH